MLAVLKKFNKLLDQRQKSKVFILFIIMLIGTFLEVVGVAMMVPIITVIVNDNDISADNIIGRICRILKIGSYNGFVVFCLVALIILYVVKNLFVIFQNYVHARFVANNRLAMQRKILEIIIARPYEYFLNANTGDITQMVIRDPSNAYSLLSTLLSTTTNVIVSLALAITIFIIEPVMTAFVVVIMTVSMLLITRVVRPKISEAGRIYRRSNASCNSWIIQAVNGIKEIKVTRREKFFTDKYIKIANTGVKSEKIYKTISGIPRAFIEMISICSTLAIILIFLINGKSLMDLLPSFGAFAVAATRLLPCINRISSAMNEITYQQPYLDKLIENLDDLEYRQEDRTVNDPTTGKSIDISLEKEVAMKGITFKYPNTERNVLENADMVIPVGKSVGIVGPSGAGKTTSVDIILGLLKAESGEILSDGTNVMDNYSGWLEKIGYIPQTIFMLDASIKDNVAFGLPKGTVDEERVWSVLKDAQLEEFVRSLPEGLESRVGERGVRISGGQRQRLGIARALYSDPELLVFDEATSSLDNDTEAAIMESINSLHGKKTMIIIAHRLQTIEGCDIVYRVDEGKITRER